MWQFECFANLDPQDPYSRTRKLEHHYPHALKVSIRDPSTNPPKAMFQLSGVRCNPNLVSGFGFMVEP